MWDKVFYILQACCFQVKSDAALLPSGFNWYFDYDWEMSLEWDLNRGPPDRSNSCAIKTSNSFEEQVKGNQKIKFGGKLINALL